MGHTTNEDAAVVVPATITTGERSTSFGGYAVHLLVVLFGISSWVAVHGIFVELPILVHKLPEGWNLPSYMTMVIQLANVGPIVYGLLHGFFPRRINETSATFVMMTVGTLACFSLIFLWSRTTSIGGVGDDHKSTLHSVHLLVLLFFVSLVDCTSSVVFLPFMGFFKEKYMVSLFIGEGFSAVLPGLVAVAQGINENPKCVNVTQNVTVPVSPDPNFGVEPFFAFVTTMMSISFVAFVLLRYLPSLESERVTSRPAVFFNRDNSSNGCAVDPHARMEHRMIFSRRRFSSYGGTDVVQPTSAEDTQTKQRMSVSTSTCLFALQTWICVLSNGVLPSISSYYCLPYGNSAYHFAASLSSVISPLACFAAFFVAVRKVVALLALTVLGTLFGVYLITLAAFSPVPPLVGTRIGEVLVVVVSICLKATFSFTKVSIASSLRIRGGVRALFWCGAATQAGSAVGALVMFVIVNYLKVFHSVHPCT